MWWSSSWAGWLTMSVLMVLFWGVLGALVVALLRRSSKRGLPGAVPDPEDVLAQRYARGELDEVQYRRRLLALRGEPAAEPVTLTKPPV